MFIPINYFDKKYAMAGVMGNLLALKYGEKIARAIVFSNDIDRFITVVNKHRAFMEIYDSPRAGAFYKDALRYYKLKKALEN